MPRGDNAGRPKGAMQLRGIAIRNSIDAPKIIKKLEDIISDPDSTKAEVTQAARVLLAKCMPDLRAQEVKIDDHRMDNLTDEEKLAARKAVLDLRDARNRVDNALKEAGVGA